MNSDSIWNLLSQFGNIISKVDHLLCEHDVDTESVRAKLTLTDGSSLRISESLIDGQLVSYSYYWLNGNNDLIVGWDNAPHHRNIETFPHHKHVKKQTSVRTSKERCLKDVLSFIHGILEE